MRWRSAAEKAEEWKKKGEPAWELNLRSAAISTALAEAVQMAEPEGLIWLGECGIGDQIDRLMELESGREPTEDNREAADLAILLHRFEQALHLQRTSIPAHGRVWQEYAKAKQSLLVGMTYVAPTTLKAKGIMTTFLPYLGLAEALSRRANIDSAAKAVDEAFTRRNHDTRMSDPLCIDGDGRIPVKWNLRKHVLIIASSANKLPHQGCPV